MTTTKSLTFGQIRDLKREAGAAGDYAMAVICDLALEGEINVDDYTVLEPHEARRIRDMDRDQAYAAIVEAINNGQG